MILTKINFNSAQSHHRSDSERNGYRNESERNGYRNEGERNSYRNDSDRNGRWRSSRERSEEWESSTKRKLVWSESKDRLPYVKRPKQVSPKRLGVTQRNTTYHAPTVHKRLGKKLYNRSDIDEPFNGKTHDVKKDSTSWNPFRSNHASESVTSQSLKKEAKEIGRIPTVKIKVEVPSRSPTPSLSPTPSPNRGSSRANSLSQSHDDLSPCKKETLKRKLDTQTESDATETECKRPKVQNEHTDLGNSFYPKYVGTVTYTFW